MFQRVLRLGQALAWLRRLSCFSTCTTSGRILESSFRLSSPKGNPILMLHGYFDVKQSTVLTGLITLQRCAPGPNQRTGAHGPLRTWWSQTC